MNVLLTGGTGFIGSYLAEKMTLSSRFEVTSSLRCLSPNVIGKPIVVGELHAETDWSSALNNQRVVVHTAARAHVKGDKVDNQIGEYRKVNVEATLNFAKQASASGVERFVFISSIGVNGNVNAKPFTEVDEPNPAEPYAQSKWEAEQGLWKIHEETGMSIVIIRPPLVYGPSAPGNFGSLVNWVEKGIPLPLGAIHNKRSLVALDNLVDLIVTCIDHPAAANQVFLAGDGEDLSTTELLRGVAKAMGKPARFIPVPAGLLQLGATLVGKKAMAQRLLGSLQVDISKARELLGWTPPLTVEEGLKRCFETKRS